MDRFLPIISRAAIEDMCTRLTVSCPAETVSYLLHGSFSLEDWVSSLYATPSRRSVVVSESRGSKGQDQLEPAGLKIRPGRYLVYARQHCIKCTDSDARSGSPWRVVLTG